MAPGPSYKKPVIPPPPPGEEVAHLVLLSADTIESLPASLTRSLSDLKELDAVLSSQLSLVTKKLENLDELCHDPTVKPSDRLELLRQIADEVALIKIGGEDKIRVATGTCETVSFPF